MSSLPVSTGDLAATIDACLAEASKALQSLHDDPSSDHAHIQWLERQLNHLVSQLQSLLLDIETGAPVGAGVWSELELAEMLEDSLVEIRNLKSLIRTLRGIGR